MEHTINVTIRHEHVRAEADAQPWKPQSTQWCEEAHPYPAFLPFVSRVGSLQKEINGKSEV